MNEALMERLQKFLLRQDRASLVGSPATQEEIAHHTGKVFICYHDTGEAKLLADSFEALIEDNFYEW